MSARDHLRLGPDGKYIWVENPEEDASADSAAPVENGADDIKKPPASTGSKGTNLTSISSSMSGPGIGDDVASKRASLIHAQGKPQIGRREPPEPYDPRPTRIMYIKGFLAALLVILIVVGIIVFLGLDYSIA